MKIYLIVEYPEKLVHRRAFTNPDDAEEVILYVPKLLFIRRELYGE